MAGNLEDREAGMQTDGRQTGRLADIIHLFIYLRCAASSLPRDVFAQNYVQNSTNIKVFYKVVCIRDSAQNLRHKFCFETFFSFLFLYIHTFTKEK